MCMRKLGSLTTIGYEMKKPEQIANLVTTTPTPGTRTTTTRTTFVALGDPFPDPNITLRPRINTYSL